MLRQRSRPYLFSNTLTPSLTAAGIAVFKMLSATTALRDKLMENTRYFRSKLEKVGFDVLAGETAIVPVMLYDAKLASDFADEMLAEGIYVIGFSYPVVPKGQARIRTQVSAAHTREDLEFALEVLPRLIDAKPTPAKVEAIAQLYDSLREVLPAKLADRSRGWCVRRLQHHDVCHSGGGGLPPWPENRSLYRIFRLLAASWSIFTRM